METALYKKVLHGYMHRSKKNHNLFRSFKWKSSCGFEDCRYWKFVVARQIKLIDFAFCHFCWHYLELAFAL